MTTGKGNKRKQKTATNNTKETCIDTVKDAKDDTKETCIVHVQDAKVDTKETCIDHEKDSKDDNKEEEKVNDHDTPIHPSPTNGAHSEHFDPIPAENKSKNLATVDISK